MGIKLFTQYINRFIQKRIKGFLRQEYDYLFIDFQFLLYHVYNFLKSQHGIQISDELMIHQTVLNTKGIVDLFIKHNGDCQIKIFFDGFPSINKLQQQKQRRRQKVIQMVQNQQSSWQNLKIQKGTLFIKDLQKAMHITFEQYKHLKIYIEDYFEAEHIISAGIKSELKGKTNKKVCVLSPDSDVVLLLCSCWQDSCIGTGHIIDYITFTQNDQVEKYFKATKKVSKWDVGDDYKDKIPLLEEYCFISTSIKQICKAMLGLIDSYHSFLQKNSDRDSIRSIQDHIQDLLQGKKDIRLNPSQSRKQLGVNVGQYFKVLFPNEENKDMHQSVYSVLKAKGDIIGAKQIAKLNERDIQKVKIHIKNCVALISIFGNDFIHTMQGIHKYNLVQVFDRGNGKQRFNFNVQFDLIAIILSYTLSLDLVTQQQPPHPKEFIAMTMSCISYFDIIHQWVLNVFLSWDHEVVNIELPYYRGLYNLRQFRGFLKYNNDRGQSEHNRDLNEIIQCISSLHQWHLLKIYDDQNKRETRKAFIPSYIYSYYWVYNMYNEDRILNWCNEYLFSPNYKQISAFSIGEDNFVRLFQDTLKYIQDNNLTRVIDLYKISTTKYQLAQINYLYDMKQLRKYPEVLKQVLALYGIDSKDHLQLFGTQQPENQYDVYDINLDQDKMKKMYEQYQETITKLQIQIIDDIERYYKKGNENNQMSEKKGEQQGNNESISYKQSFLNICYKLFQKIINLHEEKTMVSIYEVKPFIEQAQEDTIYIAFSQELIQINRRQAITYEQFLSMQV